jgi:hypothetical protein
MIEKKEMPTCERRENKWEVTPPYGESVCVNVGIDQHVVVDKLFGPLAAAPARLKIDGQSGEWVCEYQNPKTDQWEEKARWSCQENWPEDQP